MNLFATEMPPSAQEVHAAIARLRSDLRKSERVKQPGAGTGTAAASSLAWAGTDALAGRALELETAGRGFSSGLKYYSEPPTTPALGSPSLSVDANVSLGATSNVFKNGSAFLWNDTTGNTALGESALASLAFGHATENTAVGAGTLQAMTGGLSYVYESSYNTALGSGALASNSTGFMNTATGRAALAANTTGVQNTATGFDALFFNTTGSLNTASGAKALFHNTTGSLNTASGFHVLFSNTIGNSNTASGHLALRSNTTGSANAATGASALLSNTTGIGNTASGNFALSDNTTGNFNTASGIFALTSNTSGSNNVALGYEAGSNATTGNDNIFIGNEGAAGDSGFIRIGTPSTQGSTFIAGISGVSVAGEAVVVSSTGQLGVSGASSIRFKEDIQEISEVGERLLELRPVSFRYRASFSADQRVQYGLIAEEVAEVFPELVVPDAQGRPERIRYELLTPLLLDELQKAHRKILDLESLGSERAVRLGEVKRRLEAETGRVTALESALAERDQRLVAVERKLWRTDETSERGAAPDRGSPETTASPPH